MCWNLATFKFDSDVKLGYVPQFRNIDAEYPLSIFGFDRWVMLLAGADNIRDVIPFPKNSKGVEPMTAAPGTVDQEQLDELHVDVQKENKD